MSEYIDVVKTDKNFKTCIVIQIGADYFCNFQPDSGLSVASPYSSCVASLTLNPTSIDIKKVTTTISSYGFKLQDTDGIITALILGDARNLNGQAVRVFLGRKNITTFTANNMAFADFYELPTVYIKKADYENNAYSFSATEQTERMAKPIYAEDKSALGAALLVGTTIWTMRDDISGFPTSGFLKVDDEFVSYSGVDLVNNRFTGVIRGELTSTPVEHDLDTDVYLVETVTGNPLDIIMQILISNGGGGDYDLLERGLGISNTLVDIDQIEALRDAQYPDIEVTLTMYNIASALKFMEDQLLMPFSLRLTTSLNSKISLAQLDKATYVEEDDIIDHDTITKFPKWSLDGNKVTNYVEVNWDYVEGTKKYQNRSIYQDADSITDYGKQSLTYNFKGIKESLDGQALVDEFGTRLVARLCLPTPEISLNTQLDKSLQTIGDKAYLVSDKIPAADGTLNFFSDLEIISRGVNLNTGDVTLKLAFTSYTNIRSGFIAPSDIITVKTSAKIIGVASGRGAYYRAGWKMRLWNIVSNAFEADAVNEIASISGDTITFVDNWTTVFTITDYRIRFADYDDCADAQKRFAFISDGGDDFIDDKPTYKVTY